MKVAIFGAGYVGLVTGACLAAIGHEVTCVDVSQARVDDINAGRSPIYEPGLDALLTKAIGEKKLRATLDANAALTGSEISMIAVGTPFKDGRIDLSYVEQAAETIGKHIASRNDRHTVVVKSTVVPGTTGGVVASTLERASGKKAGRDFGVAMNPEFLREGCAVDDFMNADRVVVGELDAASGDAVMKLYDRFTCPKLRMALVNAEMVKYASNAFLATCISFANEICRLCESTPGADGETVMDGLSLDRRLTPFVNGDRLRPQILTFLRGGIGYGGSCFPKDLAALRTWAEEHSLSLPLVSAVMQINRERPGAIVAMLDRLLGGVSGKTVAMMGLAFKPDTDDLRESVPVAIAETLISRGAIVRAYDPKAADNAAKHFGARLTLVNDARALFEGADAAVLATSWSEFKGWDYAKLVPTMKTRTIFDGRNFLRHVTWPEGTRYVPIGRGP